ncbi:CAP domain-containing protein [Sporomusa sp.]|uniref:CAP domain-containing protein n=1 Tax=Sporomusa sp. TaxID=2078658 RepID=UPI002BEF3F4C|nr:CAP domain-containing protein [Sporomusa sp.]HWR42116.1 CAP domain-containing protein [Sporomusa sp.]
MNLNFKKKVVSGIIAISLLTTSFGGTLMTSAYAAEAADETAVNDTLHDDKADTGVIAGIVAIGLISALTNHGGKSSDNSTKSTTPSTSTGSSSQSQTTTSSASDEQQALKLLNQDRAKNGLPALKSNSQLTTLARNYAKDMINRGYFSHYNPEGQSPFDRMTKAGISYKTAGENLAVNTSVSTAETAFMNSSGHRANILNSSYTEVGVGVVSTSSGDVYVVQEFIGK